jgi:hypothetical protein
MFDFELPARFRRHVPSAVWLLVALVILAIPLKIIGYGYLPADDALRHAAKAVSGKPWPEILVLGPNYKIDQSLGWHAILGAVHQATGWDAEGLVVFSVVALFIIVNGAMLPWLKRPEAWLVALTIAMLISDLPQRELLGRPFALTMTVLMTLLFAVQYRQPDWRMFALVVVLITGCTYIHGVWYLWLLPIAAFLFAGRFRWTLLLTGAWLLGTLFSMLLSGHPLDYASHALVMALTGVGGHFTNRTEATELQPFNGEILSVVLVGALVGLRSLARLPAPPLARSPAFWLVCGCWILGFRISRFWEDWGWPALMVWLALDLELLLAAKMAADSLRRLWLALILAAAAFLCVTSDLGGRWTQALTWQFLTPENPDVGDWMPEKGGILYSAEMPIFYQTFFKNPHGDWRYILGFEPALMPADDFATYQKILWNSGDVKGYAPWVAKMKPADRLVVPGTYAGGTGHPNIPELEWKYAVSGLWIGRLPPPAK